MTSFVDGESRISIGENEEGSRLDRVLQRYAGSAGRSLVLRLIRKGNVRVNGKRCKPEHRLSVGDRIYIPASLRAGVESPAKAEYVPDKRLEQLQVLFEDDALLVVNKPAGLVVHGGSGHRQGLIEGLRLERGHVELQLAHRLDRDTSGCLLLAKNLAALRELTAAFRGREAHKTYFAWVAGCPYPSAGRLRSQLLKGKLHGGERMVAVGDGGAEAITDYQVVLHAGRDGWDYSLLALQPESGRTHQLRVQLQNASHPILGDGKYGNREANRLFREIGGRGLALHAWRLRFTHPFTKHALDFRAPWPAWWSTCFANEKHRLLGSAF